MSITSSPRFSISGWRAHFMRPLLGPLFFLHFSESSWILEKHKRPVAFRVAIKGET